MTTADRNAGRPKTGHHWLPALGFAAPITGLVLGQMVKWFALSNRYVAFLYYHDMGLRVPDTRPVSPVTRSRYWIAGLVAAGAIGVLVAGANFILGGSLDATAPQTGGESGRSVQALWSSVSRLSP